MAVPGQGSGAAGAGGQGGASPGGGAAPAALKSRDRGCPRPAGHGGGTGLRGIAAAVSAGHSRPFSIPAEGPAAGAARVPAALAGSGAAEQRARCEGGRGCGGINPDGRCPGGEGRDGVAALRAWLKRC